MTVKKYFVMYGPDTRHLIECKIFNRLTDARHFTYDIPDEKAFMLTRNTYNTDYGVTGETYVVDERVV